MTDPDRLQASRAVALVAGAIRAHDQDEAEDRARFFASAARGRPAVSEEFGRTVVLREAGLSYPFRVFRTGATMYRVDVAGHRIDAEVEPLGRWFRLSCPAGAFTIAWNG